MSGPGSSFIPDPSWPTILDLATELWGQPNEKLSSGDDIRFGSKGSKSVKPSALVWNDQEAGKGGGYVDIWRLARRGAPLPSRNGDADKVPPREDIRETYGYPGTDTDARLIQVVRTISGRPRFRQRTPDTSKKGGWDWHTKHIPDHDRRLYRLSELRTAPLDDIVWICAGEKDADRLRNAGLIATTNIGGEGEGKWKSEYAAEFRGRHCVALQDNDETGAKQVADIGRSLSSIAASVKVLLLPGLPPKGDVSNWLDDGNTIDELRRLAIAAPEYQPVPTTPEEQTLWPEPVDILADSDTGAPILSADHVPPALWPFTKDTSERMGVATSSVALAAIVSCSAAISEDWHIQPKQNDYLWTEQARLWGAIVGPPSILKSPIIKAATEPVAKLDRDARKEWEDAMADHKVALREWKALKDNPDPEPTPPRKARHIVESVTIEALQEVLRDDPDGRMTAPLGKVLCRQDELSGFLAGMDRYSTGGKAGTAEQAAWLQTYNGGDYTVDRIGRGSFSAASWSVCVLGGIQPEPIQRIATKADQDGMLQRFQYDVPAAQTGGLDRAPDYPAMVAYRDLFPALAALRPPRDRETDRPEAVILHRDAHAIREDINTLAVVMANMSNASRQLVAALGKWPGTFARLCLTFHLIGIADSRVRNPGGVHPPLNVITAQTARRVQRYMRAVLAPNLLRADAVMFSSQQSEHASWIAGYILASKLTTITARDISRDYRALKAPEQRNILDSTMDSLCRIGWLEAIEPKNHAKSPTTWTVNPRVHTAFSERAEAERKRRDTVREAIAKYAASLGDVDNVA